MNKKVVSVFLCLFLFMNSVPALATEQSESNYELTTELFVTALQSADYFVDADAYFDGENSSMPLSAVQLRLASDAQNIIMQLDLQDSTLMFNGQLLVTDETGYYNGKLVLGDFEKNGDYNIVLFKALYLNENSDRSNLTVLLERISTGELLKLQFNLTSNMFDMLKSAAVRNTAELHQTQTIANADSSDIVQRRFLQLYIPEKNFVAVNNVSITSSLSEDFMNTDANTGVGVTHTTLKTFIENVEENEVVTVSNVVLKNLLCQEDWSFYKTNTHFYVAQGFAVTDTEYAIAILLSSVSSAPNPNNPKISGSIYVTKCITLSYDSVLQEATLMFLNSGIRLEDVSVAIELVGGSTYFIEATRTYTFLNDNLVSNLLCAVSATLGTASQIWNALFAVEVTSGDYVDFGTLTAQNNRYGGPVRAVANSAGSNAYLSEPGTTIGVIGEYDSSSTYSSYRFAYRFTAVSLI